MGRCELCLQERKGKGKGKEERKMDCVREFPDLVKKCFAAWGEKVEESEVYSRIANASTLLEIKMFF